MLLRLFIRKPLKLKRAAILAEHGSIPADKITCITITSVPIPIEFRIPEASLPKTENVKIPSTKNPAKKVTCFYYCCRVCFRSSQNKPSMMTHTRKCLCIKLDHCTGRKNGHQIGVVYHIIKLNLVPIICHCSFPFIYVFVFF